MACKTPGNTTCTQAYCDCGIRTNVGDEAPEQGVKNMPYEYYLKFWGEIQNGGLVEREIGTKETDFWFPSIHNRESFKLKLQGIADKYDVKIAFIEREGENVRLKTVARMILVLPEGTEHPCEYDFGYAYPEDMARYRFEDGNYSCDCNKSLLLSREHPEIEERECGEKIQIKNFSVSLNA